MSDADHHSGAQRGQRTLAERLTERFYAWELPGRGWELWDEPVELEPRFTPFTCGSLHDRVDTDDGRRSTWLSRLADRLVSGPTGPDEQSADADDDLVAPAPDGGTRDLVELRLSLPQNADVAAEVVEQLFVTLPRLSRPLAFELLGTSEHILTQVVCEAADRTIVTGWLRAMFPEATVTAGERKLERCWGSLGPGHDMIAEMGLADEFMLPLKTLRRLSIDPLTALGAALADLERGECGVYQVLLEPVREDWAGSVRRAVLDRRGAPFFMDAPEITKLAGKRSVTPTLL